MSGPIRDRAGSPGRRARWLAYPLVLLVVAGCGDGRDAPAPARSPAEVAGPVAPTRPATAATGAATATPGPDAGHNGDALPPGLLQGNLGVVDQHGDGSQLLVTPEIDGSDGWVVVQADRDGQRGEVLGVLHRRNEAHDDTVAVPLRRRVGTGRLWVTLHVDAGTPGVFDSPGADLPLQFNGADLTREVTLTVP